MVRFSRLRAVAGCTFIAIWIALFGYRFFSPAALAGKHFFKQLPLEEIRYVSLEPNGQQSLVHRRIVIRDKAKMLALLTPMNGMMPELPQHPTSLWSVAIRIGTDKAEYGGVITGTSNQGTLFSYNSDVTKGWVFQEYLLPKSPAEVSSIISDNIPLSSGSGINR